MKKCLFINYSSLPIEDISNKPSSPTSFLPLLIQIGLRSLNSTFQDEHFTMAALKFWKSIAKIETKNMENVESHHFLGICKYLSPVILPQLYKYMNQIDETQTDIEDLTTDSVSQFAALTFHNFAYAAPAEVNEFFKEKFVSATKEKSWVIHNTAVTMITCLTGTATISTTHPSYQLIKEILTSTTIKGRDLLFKWASPGSHQYLRESSLYALAYLIKCDKNIIIDGIIGLDTIISLIESLLPEFTQEKTPNPFLLYRALSVLYNGIHSYKSLIYFTQYELSFFDYQFCY